MRKCLRIAARLYPQEWRNRYGDEFEALLDDVRPTGRDAWDIFAGAVQMHLTKGSSYVRFSVILAGLGLILGGIASFSAPKRYISTGVVRVESEPGADDRFQPVLTEVLSRGSLAEIIQRPSLNLYPKERMRVPMEDVIETMRKDVRIVSWGGTVKISVEYSDQAKAEGIARALTNRVASAVEAVNRNRAVVWRSAWPKDPLPPGQRVVLVSAPQLPDRPVGSVLPRFLTVGGAAGLLAAWLLWRPKRNLRLAGFAIVGAVVAVVVSFAIRDRYVSSAVVRISPAQAPKRLWTAVAPETPADTLRQLAEKVSQPDNLARIADRMRATVNPEDLRIVQAGPDAFRISFANRSRYHAQGVIRELIAQMFQVYVAEQRARKIEDPEVLSAIEHRAGPSLEVVDPATLPERPVFPNRLAIGAVGLPVGLLAGVFFQRRRRAVQPA